MEVDIRKEEDFDKVFKAHPDIDSVIHFAALKVWDRTSETHDAQSQLHGSQPLLSFTYAIPRIRLTPTRQSASPARYLLNTTAPMSTVRYACSAA